MKKILEVLQYGENEIRFHTDVDVDEEPNVVLKVMADCGWSMMTSLWGGKEGSVLAMIRALTVAALVTCESREDLLRNLDTMSEDLAEEMTEFRKYLEKEGVRVDVFPPHVMPPGGKS